MPTVTDFFVSLIGLFLMAAWLARPGGSDLSMIQLIDKERAAINNSQNLRRDAFLVKARNDIAGAIARFEISDDYKFKFTLTEPRSDIFAASFERLFVERMETEVCQTVSRDLQTHELNATCGKWLWEGRDEPDPFVPWAVNVNHAGIPLYINNLVKRAFN